MRKARWYREDYNGAGEGWSPVDTVSAVPESDFQGTELCQRIRVHKRVAEGIDPRCALRSHSGLPACDHRTAFPRPCHTMTGPSAAEVAGACLAHASDVVLGAVQEPPACRTGLSVVKQETRTELTEVCAEQAFQTLNSWKASRGPARETQMLVSRALTGIREQARCSPLQGRLRGEALRGRRQSPRPCR